MGKIVPYLFFCEESWYAIKQRNDKHKEYEISVYG